MNYYEYMMLGAMYKHMCLHGKETKMTQIKHTWLPFSYREVRMVFCLFVLCISEKIPEKRYLSSAGKKEIK